MKNIKARIEKDKHGNGLWLFVDRFDRPGEEFIACALSEDELIPIRDAIDQYITKGFNEKT